MNELGPFGDDIFINLSLQTMLPLPTGRETVLQFFQAVQREFGEMTAMFRRDTGEHVLEGDRDAGSYRWVELHEQRLCSGYFNPPTMAKSRQLHAWLLDRSQSFLGLSGLDVECLDVMIGFNLDYQGNRDGLVAEALLADSPLGMLVQGDLGRCVEFEPGLVLALESDCNTQARVAIEPRCNSMQVSSGDYTNDPISVHLTVRRYPVPGRVMDLPSVFDALCDIAEDLAARVIMPQILAPLASAIASR